MWLYKINHALGPAIGSYWRLGLAGAVDAIPKDGPILLASNHSSYLDPWFIGMAFPRYVRYLITADWYYRNGAWRRVFSAWGTLPVTPNDPQATIASVCGALDQGDVVGMFPEGKISHDGRLRKFRSGLARMAAASGAPVIPVGVRGAFESLPRSRRFPRPRRVTIHLGKPFVFPGAPHAGDIPAKEGAEFHDRLVREICRLTGQEDRIDELLRAGTRRAELEARLSRGSPPR